MEAGGRNGRFTKGLAVRAGERELKRAGPGSGKEDLKAWTVRKGKRLGRGGRVVGMNAASVQAVHLLTWPDNRQLCTQRSRGRPAL